MGNSLHKHHWKNNSYITLKDIAQKYKRLMLSAYKIKEHQCIQSRK